MQAYSDPTRADDPHALPDIEYWYDDADISYGHARNFDAEGNPVAEGWYWWACFPGCMPDSEPNGPFATEAECIADFTDESDDEPKCDDPGAHRLGCHCNGGEPLL